ncbi:MAG TPA: DinB family protein [Candidatus Acidoferrales bacterium]|nr:DinB family protein [Candidatus Acidoferrales bacterium]
MNSTESQFMGKNQNPHAQIVSQSRERLLNEFSSSYTCQLRNHYAISAPNALGARTRAVTQDQRRAKLDAFGHSPIVLTEFLRKCPRHMWSKRVSAELWSIHEIILHLADSEMESYIFCRQFIAEPGSLLWVRNLAAWAGALGYLHQSPQEALELIAVVRSLTYQILRRLSDPVWSHTCRYTHRSNLTLEQWLDCQQLHVSQHLEQIRQNYLTWVCLRPRRRSSRFVTSKQSEANSAAKS